MGSTTGDARLHDSRAAPWARLSHPGKDFELVLIPARLAEGVVVGIEGGTAQVDGVMQDVAGCGVDVLYFIPGEGARFSRGMDAG